MADQIWMPFNVVRGVGLGMGVLMRMGLLFQIRRGLTQVSQSKWLVMMFWVCIHDSMLPCPYCLPVT